LRLCPLVFAAAASLAGGLAREARAEPTPEDRALAAVLFQRARALVQDGHQEDACPLFEESERLDPGGGTLLNLALCHEAIGKTGSAWGELLEARALARHDDNQERLDIAESHLDALTPKLANLVVEVPEAARIAGLEIVRDERPLSMNAWGIAAPVDPGKHLIRASAPGHEAWSIEVEVKPGPSELSVPIPILAEKQVEPPRLPAEPPKPAPHIPDDRQPPIDAKKTPTLVWAGIGIGSVGIASLAVGTASGIAAILKRRASEKEAPTCDPGCSQHAVDLNDQAIAAADVSTATFVVGGVLSATGLALLIAGLESKKPTVGHSLSFAIGPTGAAIRGSFQ